MPKLFQLYKKGDYTRVGKEEHSSLEPEPYRSEFRKDYARILHSCAFRRLQGKTQLFPGKESDYFRNRLTHSLEVAQIAKSIANRLNYLEPQLNIDTDLVELSGLAHDIGHPPFGHQGEDALNNCMRDHGGFEGNAQTLRLLSKVEKKFDRNYSIQNRKDKRVGLNLTYRALASVLKYDKLIKVNSSNKRIRRTFVKKGYYQTEKDLVDNIKMKLLHSKNERLLTIECQIMEIADDIAYSTFDLEDSFKAGFLSPYDCVFPPNKVKSEVIKRVNKKYGYTIDKLDIYEVFKEMFKTIFQFEVNSADFEDEQNSSSFFQAFLMFMIDTSYKTSISISKKGGYRTSFMSHLVGELIRGVKISKLDTNNPCLSKVDLDYVSKLKLEILKQFNYVSQIRSPRVSIVEFRGRMIVKHIFDSLVNESGINLLPEDFRDLYEGSDKVDKKRIICDYIAGMTDAYATEFYGRLTSEYPQTFFKPF